MADFSEHFISKEGWIKGLAVTAENPFLIWES